MQSSSREEFEAWAHKFGMNVAHHKNFASYEDGVTWKMWRAWQAARATAWKPIELAPKDGTEVMLYAPVQQFNGKPTPARITQGYWLCDEGGTTEYRDLDGNWVGQNDSDGFEVWMSSDGGFTEENPPTHFQPLPPPPEAV